MGVSGGLKKKLIKKNSPLMQIGVVGGGRLKGLGLEHGLNRGGGGPGSVVLCADLGLKLVQAAEQGAHGLLMPSLKRGRGVDKIGTEIDGLLGRRGEAFRGRPNGHRTLHASCFYTFLLTACASQSGPQCPHQEHRHSVQACQAEHRHVFGGVGIHSMFFGCCSFVQLSSRHGVGVLSRLAKQLSQVYRTPVCFGDQILSMSRHSAPGMQV